ncbi:integrase [Bifidobacterium pseudolongum subsp. globosum]|uniref:Integrase n=1 Tax=Bifidobacterium pseudolongum subsp. globosum TaxID=1690 RepID=A0A4Q4ZZV3_9BIFI|nr:helix-turn-helix domain-containing protein [Bifidobacterium pseudolongum]RYQ08837.1 integrase [Bifidobacterium pseudolongum subsp. globosum]
MGAVYSHLSEEERQVVQIEIGNGTGIRAVGTMLRRSASAISRQINHDMWLPSNEWVVPTKTPQGGPWAPSLYRRSRAVQGRTAQCEAAQAVSLVGYGCLWA